MLNCRSMLRASSASKAYAAELARLSTAPATRELYDVQIQRLRAYCKERGVDPYCLSAEHICDFLAHIHELAGGYAVIRMCVAAIGRLYMGRGRENPTRHRAVRQFVRGLRRATKIATLRPVLTEDLIRITKTCGRDIRGLRDRALLLVAFAGPLRRCELTALRTQDLILTGEAIVLLHPRRLIIQRGTEPETCPVTAVREYLAATRISSGPLWRGFDHRDRPSPRALSYRSVWQILHDRARAAGVPHASWTGFRFGFIEAAAKLPLFELQKRTLISDRQALRGQLQRGRAYRRAAVVNSPGPSAVPDRERDSVAKPARKPLLFTWQTVSDVRSDLERLYSSRRRSRSEEEVRHPKPPQKLPRATLRPEKLVKQQRGHGRSRRYTQADVAEIRSELTRLYGSTCASVRSSP
jgi:site-specific recombinase XerD